MRKLEIVQWLHFETRYCVMCMYLFITAWTRIRFVSLHKWPCHVGWHPLRLDPRWQVGRARQFQRRGTLESPRGTSREISLRFLQGLLNLFAYVGLNFKCSRSITTVKETYFVLNTSSFPSPCYPHSCQTQEMAPSTWSALRRMSP